MTREDNIALVRLLGAPIGTELGRGTYKVQENDVVRFSKLLGNDELPEAQEHRATEAERGGRAVPPGMIFIFSLRLGWELQLFPPGAIRMGDENEFFVPARVGDVLTSSLKVAGRFTKKDRQFIRFLCETLNEDQERICTVEFTACLPHSDATGRG